MNPHATRGETTRAARRGSSGVLVLLVLLVAAGTVAACSSASRGATGTVHKSTAQTSAHHKAKHASASTSTSIATQRGDSRQAPATFGVGMSIATWTDPEGSTRNYFEGTTERGREMQVEILYPTLSVGGSSPLAWATPAYRFGPYPVIVFAHGYDVDPNTYRALLMSWAQAGYVVIAPLFPDTSLAAIQAQDGAYTESDTYNQPADVAFVVSQIVDAAHGKAPPYAAYLVGLVDSAKLILAGQSDGADTAAALMYDHEYAATLASMAVKPIAVALLSGAEWTRGVDEYSVPTSYEVPALVVQALTDPCNVPSDSSVIYNMLSGTKWFLALEDATHLGPYVGLGADAAIVEQVTISFFDLESGRRTVTAASLEARGDRSALSTITSATSVPLYASPEWVEGACSAPAGAPTN